MGKERIEELNEALIHLKEACRKGDLDTVKNLIGNNYDIMEFSYRTSPTGEIIKTGGFEKIGTTPMEEAIFHDQLDLVKYMMEKGVKLPKKFYVLTKMSKEMALLLIDHGAPITPEPQNAFGDTHLHFAAGQGAFGCLEALVECGADLHVKNKYQQTPLHKAIMYKQTEVVHYLLENGASVHIAEWMGNTALHYAMSAKGELVEMVLNYGAQSDLLKVNRMGKLPIHRNLDRSKPFQYLMEQNQSKPDLPLFPTSIHLHPTLQEALTPLRDGGIAKWKVTPSQEPELLQQVHTDHFKIRDLDISPEGTHIALVAEDLKGVEIRRYEDLQLEKKLDSPELSDWFRHIKYSPDGKWLCTAPTIYDLHADGWLQSSGGDYSHAIAISSDSSVLAVAEYEQGSDVLEFFYIDPKNDHEIDVLYPTRKHRNFPRHLYESTIHDVCFLPDNKRFVYYEEFENCNDADNLGQITMGLVHEERELWRITLETPLNSYGERKLICTETEIICAADGSLVFLDLETGKVKKKVVLDPYYVILDLTLDPDQQRVWVVINNQIKEVVL